jgi:signal transduction histidine kinase
VPVEIDAVPEHWPPANIEAAAYFVVAEALTNVARYARADSARVAVTGDDGQLVVEIADDGVGGADPAQGSGLRGLEDRLAALDGGLEVESEPGRGTTVRAVIPVHVHPPVGPARVSVPSRTTTGAEPDLAGTRFRKR